MQLFCVYLAFLHLHCWHDCCAVLPQEHPNVVALSHTLQLPTQPAKHFCFVHLLMCFVSLEKFAFCVADMAIAHIFWDEFGIMATDPGYGYFRPTINLFDPGWRLTRDGHDMGTHAAGVMDR